MYLSICILTHSQPELLPKCVSSCFSEIQSLGIESEVIVIDNASADKYPEKLTQIFPQTLIIRNEQNLGFSAANNIGIRASRGRYILILNDDAMLRPGSLGIMIQTIQSDPRIGAVGPKLLNIDGSVQRGFSNKRAVTLRSVVCDTLCLNPVLGKWMLTRTLLTRMGDDNASGEPAEIAGACLLVRRAALDEVGLFDERFCFSFEDTDLCYRLRKAGWSLLYLSDAQVTHYGAASFRRLKKVEQIRIFYQSMMRFLRKHWGPVRYWLGRATVALIFVLLAPVVFVYRIVGRKQNFVEAKNAAGAPLRLAHWLISGRE